MQRFSILLLVVLCYSACKNDDDMVVTSNCEGGITYSLDFQAESIHERNLWLTEADGDLAFDEEVDASAVGLQFLNFDDACEDRYTVSVGYYDTDDNPYPGDYGKELRVREFAAVPNGSVVDLQSAGVNGSALRGLMPNWLIAIPNCPPIDSALLQVKLDPLAPNAPTVPYYFDYYPEDNTLVLYTEEAWVTAPQALMALRNASTGEWLGEILDFRQELPTTLVYEDLKSMNLQSTRVQWPSEARDVELEYHWVHDPSGRKVTMVGLQFEEGNIEVPIPAEVSGPYIITARWEDDYAREVRYVMDEWPEELNIISSLQGEVLSFEYPNLEISTSGLNIISVDGAFVNSSGYYSQRQYVAEAKEGAQQIQFAPLSPAMDATDPDIKQLYEQALNESGRLDLYYYQETDGTYSWYFRNILSEPVSAEAWLKSMRYERLLVPFN